MQQLAYTDHSYQTPADAASFVGKLFPSFSFYTSFLTNIYFSSRKAQKGNYDDTDWCQSSYKVLKALERAGVTVSVNGIDHLQGMDSPCVIIDESVAFGVDGRFKLWYEGGDVASDTQNTIGHATSGDGLTWLRRSLPILIPSSDSLVPLPFDSGDLEHPTAVIRSSVPSTTEGHFLLWYTGDGEGSVSPNRIGLARGADAP